jgi:hypothetical protein
MNPRHAAAGPVGLERPDRPEDVTGDPQVHAVTIRIEAQSWGIQVRPECTCGWRGAWGDRVIDAQQAGLAHQAIPAGELDR